MPWTVAETVIPASRLKGVLDAIAAAGMEAQVHLAGPMGRTPQGQVLYEACYLVLARAAEPRQEAATPSAAPVPALGPVEEPPIKVTHNWLIGLQPGLRDVLAAVGIVSIETLAAAWPDGIDAIDGLTLQDGRAIERLLGAWDRGDPPPVGTEVPVLKPKPRLAYNPPPTYVPPPGVVVIPGMENARIVPRGYTREHTELPPDLREAAILDGKPNVHYQSAIILPRRPLRGDRDGVTEPGELS